MNHAVRDDQGRVIAILNIANVYRYKGFTFEFHRYCGPMKINKDGEPSKTCGRKFWKAFDEWNNLTKEQKEDTQIAG